LDYGCGLRAPQICQAAFVVLAIIFPWDICSVDARWSTLSRWLLRIFLELATFPCSTS
jgi:hypothetical protein